jgi:hypothetical protein
MAWIRRCIVPLVVLVAAKACSGETVNECNGCPSSNGDASADAPKEEGLN